MARPFVVTLALAALVATAGAAPRAGSSAASLLPLSTVPADVPQAALDARLKGDVVVRVHVSRLGLVDSASVVSGDARLREAAVAAARWYLYAPQPAPAWTTTTVAIDGTVEAEPLPLDILAMAREAEHAGDFRASLDAWAGALNRCGTHPTIRNPWAIREHVAELQQHLPAAPELLGESRGTAVAARVRQQRTVSRAEHAELVLKFEDAERNLPWWDELYQWDAASLVGAGRSQDAIRALLVFRAATRDSASRHRADRAIAGIAAGDTVMVGEMLKKEGRQFEPAE
jgi:TonB family protein